MKNHSEENLIQDSRNPTENNKNSEFEVPLAGGQSVSEGLSSLGGLIDGNNPVSIEHLDKIGKSIDASIDSDKNLKILLEIEKGNLDNVSKLTFITDKAAENILKHARTVLSLEGLTSIPDSVLDILSAFKGNLELDGLVEISDQTAEKILKLGAFTVSLAGLKSVPKPIVIHILSGNKWPLIYVYKEIIELVSQK